MTISTQKDKQIIPHVCPKCGGRINEITPHEHNCVRCGKYIDWDENWVSTIMTPTAKYSFFVSDMRRISDGERNRKAEQDEFDRFVRLNAKATRKQVQNALGIRHSRIKEMEKVSGVILDDEPASKEENQNDPTGLNAIKAKRRQIRLRELLDEKPDATIRQIAKITGWTQSGVIYTARCIGHRFQNTRNAVLTFQRNQAEKHLKLIKEVMEADPEISAAEIAENHDINVWQVRKLAAQLGLKFPQRPGSPNINKIRQHLIDNPKATMRELARLVNANPHTVAYYCEVYGEMEGGFDVIDKANYLLRTKQQKLKGIAEQNSKRNMLNGNLNPTPRRR